MSMKGRRNIVMKRYFKYKCQTLVATEIKIHLNSLAKFPSRSYRMLKHYHRIVSTKKTQMITSYLTNS